MMKRSIALIVFAIVSATGFAQGPYAPAAGETGSKAIHKDSVVITGWASNCVLQLGSQNISQSGSPLAAVGTVASATGAADGNVVSLGDGGSATLTFANPITNKGGFDFAVFENGFKLNTVNNYFLELGHVEVSSDGTNFFRFPSDCLTDSTTQIGAFAGMDPTNINNLAGKYVGGYGTPFDLELLKGKAGLNINAVTHVRIIDVVGSVNSSYGSRDSKGKIINDPWPTEFASCGFDLDGVAVLNMVLSRPEERTLEAFKVYPNPTAGILYLNDSNQGSIQFKLTDLSGRVVENGSFPEQNQVDVSSLPTGIYFLILESGKTKEIRKIVKQ